MCVRPREWLVGSTRGGGHEFSPTDASFAPAPAGRRDSRIRARDKCTAYFDACGKQRKASSEACSSLLLRSWQLRNFLTN